MLNLDLVRRIERVLAPEVPPAQEIQDPSVPVVRQYGRTIASKAKGGRPTNTVFCFGADDLEHLDAILAFYSSDGLEPTFYLTPTGFTRDVARALSSRGFSQLEFQQAILYGVPSTFSAPPLGVTVERVTAQTLDDFARATAAGFEWPREWRDDAMENIRRAFRANAYHFLVRYRDQAVGVGSLVLREDVAILEDAGVVPEFRGRGCHAALLQHRLQAAQEAGCTLVIGAADFGSASFRNQQRVGLRLAYIESGWARA